MITPYTIQRWLLHALVVLLAVSTALGDGHGASAKDNARPRPDYASKEAFKLECELLGGTFSEDGIGNTNCRFPDGTWIECDANGKDCWVTNASRPQLPGDNTMYPGSGNEMAPVSGGAEPPAAAVDDTSSPTVDQGVASPDADQQATVKAKHGHGKKSKKGKKHGHGVKGRK
jgi:hypothetical protein